MLAKSSRDKLKPGNNTELRTFLSHGGLQGTNLVALVAKGHGPPKVKDLSLIPRANLYQV